MRTTILTILRYATDDIHFVETLCNVIKTLVPWRNSFTRSLTTLLNNAHISHNLQLTKTLSSLLSLLLGNDSSQVYFIFLNRQLLGIWFRRYTKIFNNVIITEIVIFDAKNSDNDSKVKIRDRKKKFWTVLESMKRSILIQTVYNYWKDLRVMYWRMTFQHNCQKRKFLQIFYYSFVRHMVLRTVLLIPCATVQYI